MSSSHLYGAQGRESKARKVLRASKTVLEETSKLPRVANWGSLPIWDRSGHWRSAASFIHFWCSLQWSTVPNCPQELTKTTTKLFPPRVRLTLSIVLQVTLPNLKKAALTSNSLSTHTQNSLRMCHFLPSHSLTHSLTTITHLHHLPSPNCPHSKSWHPLQLTSSRLLALLPIQTI